ncbi:MAG: transcriptional repressor [Telmatospirillum sp.]|nr:transcriptional repressor [Telmatospirillum sp.]
MTSDINLFPSRTHDHAGCVKSALDAAAACCEKHGARFTALRRRVLELVWTSHEPIGAYALLDTLKAEGQAAAPPTVYRALDFLIEQGLVHRLERLNAFVGCPHPDSRHSAHFLICTECGRAAELRDNPAIDAAIRQAADAFGFTVSRQTIEVEGICPDCRDGLGTAEPKSRPSASGGV